MQGASAAGKSAQMGLSQLGGVFIVLSGGMIVSCFIAVIEFMWENRKVSSQGVRIIINIKIQGVPHELSGFQRAILPKNVIIELESTISESCWNFSPKFLNYWRTLFSDLLA